MLRVNDLAVSYGTTPVLCGLSLSVDSGEIVAVIGRNAAGKTTLFKAIMGLLPAHSGTLSLDGENLTPLPAYQRARRGLGYVPQGRMIFAELTVQENLLIGADLNPKEGNKRIEAILHQFPRLAERLRQLGGTLSGGEQQMLALGRTLVGNPKMLLLDEPTAGIQPSIVTEIEDRLRTINSQTDLPMIIVEHNLELVASLSSRVYVMNKGTIVAEIEPDQAQDESIVRAHLAI